MVKHFNEKNEYLNSVMLLTRTADLNTTGKMMGRADGGSKTANSMAKVRPKSDS